MSLNKVTLTGTYLDGSGNPLYGTVAFAPSVPLTDTTDSEIVLQAPVTVAVNSAGQFSVALYGTDDADLAPTGWTWQITENIAGLTASTWSFFLAWADGSTQDLSDLAPVAEVTPVAAYLPESGGTMSGTVVLGGSPPLKLPSGTSGYVLTSDSSGDITLQPGGAGGNVLTAFNVKSAPYGAVGNGATDDTAAIASALTAASSGGIVYFPPGVYLVSSPLQITSGITIQGAGATVSVMKGSAGFPYSSQGGVLQFGSGTYTTSGPTLTGCRIADIGFDMTAVNDGTRNQVNAIFQDYCCLQDLRIERIWYSGQENGDCIMLNGLGRGQVAQWARGITIRDVYALNGGGSVCCYFNANDTGSKLSGIEIQNIYSYVSADVEDDRVVISANFPSGSTGNYAYLRDVTIRDIFVDVASGSSGTVNGVKLDTGAYGQIQNVLISGVHYYALASGGAIGNPVIMYSAGTGGATGYLQDYVVENVFAQNSYGVELFLNRFTTAPQVTVRNVVMENCRDPLYLVSLQTQSTATGDEIVTFDGVSGNSVTSPGTYVPMGIQLWSGSSAKGASGAVLARGLMFTGVTYGITSTVNGSGNGTAATAYSNIVVRDSNLSGATTPVSLANTYTVSSVTGVTFGEISAKAYGATGNGSTDDTAALTAWINAVNAAANGARAFLPAGDYIVSSALPSITNAGTTIYGAGWGQVSATAGSTISVTGGYSGGPVLTLAAEGIQLEKLNVTGNNHAATLIAVDANNCQLQFMAMRACSNASVTTPAVAASGTPVTNSTGQNVTVTLSGGTVTAVVVNSLTVATATSSTVVVPAGQTITLTYSAAPTWTWTGYGTCLDVWPNGTSMWAHNIRLEGINTPSCAIQVNATDAVLTGVKPASCTWGIMLLSGASGAQVEASHMSPGGPNCIWVNGNPGEVLISGNRFDAYTSSAVQLTPPTSIPFDITITGNDFYSTVMTDDAYALIGVDTTLAGIRNLKITNNGGWAASSNRPAYGVSAQTQAGTSASNSGRLASLGTIVTGNSWWTVSGLFGTGTASSALGNFITTNGSTFAPATDVYAFQASQPVSAIGNTGASPTLTASSGAVQTATLNAATVTWAFANPTSTAAWTVTLIQSQDATGGRAVVWPASVQWQGGGTTPTLSTAASATDVLTFMTPNGGTTWYGSVAGLNYQP